MHPPPLPPLLPFCHIYLPFHNPSDPFPLPPLPLARSLPQVNVAVSRALHHLILLGDTAALPCLLFFFLFRVGMRMRVLARLDVVARSHPATQPPSHQVRVGSAWTRCRIASFSPSSWHANPP